MQLPIDLRNKLESLISYLNSKKIIVAFSGGVDSSLLAYLSKKYAKETLLLTINSDLNPSGENEEAKRFAKKHKISHREIMINLLENKEFVNNPKERCYICKKEIFSNMIEIKQSENYDLIIDGSNIDDKDDFRPGMKALTELNVDSPYILFDINKQDIRELSRYFNLETYSKPSSACLASRIPYAQKITKEKLQMISKAEEFLKKQFNLTQLRVRYHEGRLARIELLSNELPKILNQKNLIKIKNKLKELGFVYITLDVEGFRSGSLNEIFS
jgi:uncharacterized protein